MAKILRTFALVGLFVVSCGLLHAQQARRVAPKNIFEALESEAPGEGFVVIEQSDELRRLVGGSSSRYGAVLGREGNISLLMGYRIQLYNGNRPNSKAEVERRAAMLRRLVPDHQYYITYNAPFWKLVVGDFLSVEAARTARAQMLRALPAWGRESYVVRDKVRILNYTPPSDVE